MNSVKLQSEKESEKIRPNFYFDMDQKFMNFYALNAFHPNYSSIWECIVILSTFHNCDFLLFANDFAFFLFLSSDKSCLQSSLFWNVWQLAISGNG